MTVSPSTPFRYAGYDVDERQGTVTARYQLGELIFEEQVRVPGGGAWGSAATREAARIFYLLAGVSYYKAAAPSIIDLDQTPVRSGDADFLRGFYLEGLGEFAYRNGLDLSGLRVVGGRPAVGPASFHPVGDRPLIPFGGGIDSIVTVNSVARTHPGAALFVMGRQEDRFAAIESAAAVTGLPIRRAERRLDEKILRSEELGFYNGHVPVTGILSAVAVLVAVLAGCDTIVMSNEWSSSVGNFEFGNRTVNHQYSKSMQFEVGFRALLERSFEQPVDYFSLLRPYTELWVAERFARLEPYHSVFRSCNRAFYLDPAERLDHWCGRCDKCCFTDLILAPFMPAAELSAVFGGNEPLDNPDLKEQFRTLLGVSDQRKPFECVGDADECKTAAVLAAARPDRAGHPLLMMLAAEAGRAAGTDVNRLLRPIGANHIPTPYAPEDLLV
jgi:UDP-N-acetyl-alpha-D-muramoyl-L-alanyl-L-glutamate epimerase